MSKNKSILIVLGMHRSGTSVLTRILNILGADPGRNLMPPAEDNPTGFWEPVEIVQVHDELLSHLGYSWNDPRPLPHKWWERHDLEEFRTRLHNLAIQQYSDIDQPIIKDPRLCRLLPFWQKIFAELGWEQRYIHIIRTPLDVAASLTKREGFSANHSHMLWLRYVIEAERWSRGNPRAFMLYDQLFDSWESEVRRCTYELAQKKVRISATQKSAINGFLDPSLRHNCAGQSILNNPSDTTPLVLDTYLLLREAASGVSNRGELQDKFNLINQRLHALDNLYSSIWKLYLKERDHANNQVEVIKEEVKVISADLEHNRRLALIHEKQNNELIDKIHALADKCGRSEALADELTCRIEEYSAIDRDQEQKISELQNENSKLGAELARKVNDLTAEIDNAKRRQSQHENTKQELLEKIEIKQKESDELSCRLAAAEFSAAELRGVCETEEAVIKSLQDELRVQADDLSRYRSWMQELNTCIKALFLSKRWQAGEYVGKLACMLKMQRSPKTAKEQMLEILEQHDAVVSSEIQQHGPWLPVKDTDEPNHWGTLYRLITVALKNPAQTARLLAPRRIANFLATIIRHDPYRSEWVYDHYLRLYQDSAASTAVDPYAMEAYTNDELAQQLALAETPRVSIVIPVFNQWEYTRRCINSIIHNIPNHSGYEIILADDGSSDETVNALKYFPFLVITKPAENVGFLLNCNQAASKARGEYIVFLNNDTVVHENWLQELVCVFENDPDVGLAGSKLIYPDNKLQEAGGIIWQDGSGWNYGRMDDPDKPEYNYAREVDYISGASIMLRTALWNDIGGFDARYKPAYYEDTDLAFAVRNAGYKVIYTPFSVVTHYEGQSNGTDESSGIKKYQSQNKDKFAEKWRAVLTESHFSNGENVFRARESRSARKTILVIDHYVPHFDKDAGSRSTFQYLKWFINKGLSVKFIGDNFYKHEPYTTELQRMGVEVLYGSWYAKNWQKWLNENGDEIDYAFLHRPHIAPKYIDAIREFTKAKIIFFGHDLHYLRIQRQYEIEKDSRLAKEAKEWKDKEYAIFDKVDVVYYPSYVEVEEIKKQPPACPVRAIPLNIVEEIEDIRPLNKNRRDLIFVGGFNHNPNVDAIQWFVSEIFPVVLQENKDIKLNVVGSNMPKSVRELASEVIVIWGEVTDEELESLYHAARMSVVPLRYGAGVKGKVLEALRLQIPVVTTPIGAEGLEDADKYLSISDDPRVFAEKIISLNNDDLLWAQQVENGVKALNHYFSDKRVSEILGQDIILS